jgi:hypothetical protein
MFFYIIGYSAPTNHVQNGYILDQLEKPIHFGENFMK